MTLFTEMDIVNSIKIGVSFSAREVLEKLNEREISPILCVLRRKLNDMKSRGLLTRTQQCPALYQCNGHQVKSIIKSYNEAQERKESRAGYVEKYKKRSKPRNSQKWVGAKIKGYAGETILMIGCVE